MIAAAIRTKLRDFLREIRKSSGLERKIETLLKIGTPRT